MPMPPATNAYPAAVGRVVDAERAVRRVDPRGLAGLDVRDRRSEVAQRLDRHLDALPALGARRDREGVLAHRERRRAQREPRELAGREAQWLARARLEREGRHLAALGPDFDHRPRAAPSPAPAAPGGHRGSARPRTRRTRPTAIASTRCRGTARRRAGATARARKRRWRAGRARSASGRTRAGRAGAAARSPRPRQTARAPRDPPSCAPARSTDPHCRALRDASRGASRSGRRSPPGRTRRGSGGSSRRCRCRTARWRAGSAPSARTARRASPGRRSRAPSRSPSRSPGPAPTRAAARTAGPSPPAGRPRATAARRAWCGGSAVRGRSWRSWPAAHRAATPTV